MQTSIWRGKKKMSDEWKLLELERLEKREKIVRREEREKLA